MTSTELQADEINRPDPAGEAEGQFLTFMLVGEEYGVEILRVQEIKGWESATPIPNTPDHVLGVLNLRGAVVPIIDLRKRFQLDSVSYEPTTVVIVVKILQSGQERTVGLVVDAVADVYRLENSEIQPAPEMGSGVDTEFIRGLATVEGKMVILLELDSLLDDPTLDSARADEMAAEEIAEVEGVAA